MLYSQIPGKYAVGTSTNHLKDRDIMVQLWYPTPGELQLKPTTPYATSYEQFLKREAKLIWFVLMSRPAFTFVKYEKVPLFIDGLLPGIFQRYLIKPDH